MSCAGVAHRLKTRCGARCHEQVTSLSPRIRSESAPRLRRSTHDFDYGRARGQQGHSLVSRVRTATRSLVAIQGVLRAYRAAGRHAALPLHGLLGALLRVSRVAALASGSLPALPVSAVHDRHAPVSAAVLPRLAPLETLEPNVVAFLDALARGGFAGEIRTDYATRLIAATDNSIYQLLPVSVIFPKSRRTWRSRCACSRAALPRRHAHRARRRHRHQRSGAARRDHGRVSHMASDPGARPRGGWVRVEPGVVLDQLNAFLAARRLLRAEPVAEQPRHVRRHDQHRRERQGLARVRQDQPHVIELAVVLRDGTCTAPQRVSGAELEALSAAAGSSARPIGSWTRSQPRAAARSRAPSPSCSAS